MPRSRANRADRGPSTTPARVVRHLSEFGDWESVFRAPDPRLRAVVEGDYQGWIEGTTSFAKRREVPSGIVPLILNLGPPYRVFGPMNRDGSAETLRSFVAGLHDSFTLVEATGPTIGVQVNLTPVGAYRAFGRPMDGLANRSVELEDVLGADARRLVERLHDEPDWEGRFAILDAFFLGRLAGARPASGAVGWAWGRLIETGGMVAIGTLAEEVGWSRKHLIARFKEQVGMPPRLAGRIIRFQQVVRRLQGDDPPRWSAVAHDCGYCDQSHLIRDFVAFAGTTPVAFLGRRLPDGGGFVGD